MIVGKLKILKGKIPVKMEALKTLRSQYEEKLQIALLSPFSANNLLNESIRYSLTHAGKHLRPFLIFAVLAAYDKEIEIGLNAALAVEYIHTYSLIHDDLPAMDNDDYRRGVLSNHKQFDEATAILAGDALLTYAFEVLQADAYTFEKKAKLTALLARSSGYEGMVLGQTLDICSEEQNLCLEALVKIHRKKTGALFSYCLQAGSLLADATREDTRHLIAFAEHFGLAYQIHNDLQELLWSDDARGKKQHGDQSLGKNTYPSLLGLQEAKAALTEQKNSAKEAVLAICEHKSDFKPEYLLDFLDYLAI